MGKGNWKIEEKTKYLSKNDWRKMVEKFLFRFQIFSIVFNIFFISWFYVWACDCSFNTAPWVTAAENMCNITHL